MSTDDTEPLPADCRYVIHLPAGGRIMTIEDYDDELDWLGEWRGRRG